jgi:hypothetical protein
MRCAAKQSAQCCHGVFVLLAWLAPVACAQTLIGLHLEWQGGVPHVESTPLAGQRLRLEHSQDLLGWTEMARVPGRLHRYGDWQHAGEAVGFYRLLSLAAQPSDDWSNQVSPEAAGLFKRGSGSGLAATAFVKWSLLLKEPDRVYFQDSVRYPYHLQFARARLPGYANMGAIEYNAQSLYATAGQRMVLGSVMRAPDAQVRELGIEITGAEAFPATQAAAWAEVVKRRVVLEPGWRIYYLPSTEQRAETESHLPLFAARGLEVSSLNRWASEPACYSTGWALGRLVYVPTTEIPAALGEGRLTFTDILVTDHVPAELPVLPGYLSREPATPNSHVALLARSLLLPFAYVNGAGMRAELASLDGREVLLTVGETNGACTIALLDTTDRLTPERRQEILDSKRGSGIDIVPRELRGAFTVPADPLTPADVRYVGGKTANFGFLRRSLPHDSPAPALAITFDLWEAYLSQTLPGTTNSLRQFIVARLAHHTFPPNVAALRTDLAAIRDRIENSADFTPAQRTSILDAMWNAGLRGAKIRCRSSTNVEDGDTFSGAGLYDSYSGCIEDDTDGDTGGPSQCDPAEPKERGVLRALRKVYASFYNENAFLERLRHGINEDIVGMAVLVHFSSPDSEEMANGVATLAVEKGDRREAAARIVSQLGAVSVTNPDPDVLPEVVSATWSGADTTGAMLMHTESSSLTENGEPVMPWETDYRTLIQQLNTAALAWEEYYPERRSFELDFEYKRLRPGRVGLKQIRVVPHPVPVPVPVIP